MQDVYVSSGQLCMSLFQSEIQRVIHTTFLTFDIVINFGLMKLQAQLQWLKKSSYNVKILEFLVTESCFSPLLSRASNIGICFLL